MRPSRRDFPPALRLLAASGLLAAQLLGCTTGTPAAPEGSKMFISFAYVPGSRNVDTGDFEAVVRVRVLDSISDVPQTGVGVFFRVSSGPGLFVEQGAVRTNNDGEAQNVLVAQGATGESADRQVTIVASSGETQVELTLDVNSGSTSEDLPPEACFTTNVSGTRVTVDAGCSTDADCAGGEPDTYTVDWGDGAVDDDLPFSQPTIDHTYAPGSYDIEVTVIDCQNLTDRATRTVNVQ